MTVRGTRLALLTTSVGVLSLALWWLVSQHWQTPQGSGQLPVVVVVLGCAIVLVTSILLGSWLDGAAARGGATTKSVLIVVALTLFVSFLFAPLITVGLGRLTLYGVPADSIEFAEGQLRANRTLVPTFWWILGASIVGTLVISAQHLWTVSRSAIAVLVAVGLLPLLLFSRHF